MKKALLLILVLGNLTVLAQTKKEKEVRKELKIESTDGKYQVTLITTEDGKSNTITRSYNSLEEMKNDPEMADVKIMKLHDKGDNMMFFGDEKGEGEKDIKVIINGDAEFHSDHEIDIDEDHTFTFKSGDDSEAHNIKVWVDENGDKHISKDGQEIKGNTWTSEDGKTYDIKKMDGKVMFLSDDSAAEFITEDGKHVDVKVKVEGKNDGDNEMFFVESFSEDGDSEGEHKMVIKIVEEIKIHLEEVEENEFSEFPGINAKALKLDELNYYPNPNSGRFTLAFQSDNRPTEIKITSVNGQEVYNEVLQSFEGSYNKEIDLSGQKPGIYLLQILQGKKAMNKKIVIE